MINSPGIWLCKVLVKGYDLSHWVSLEIKEINPKSIVRQGYPPYICFVPAYITSDIGKNVSYEGDWIWKIYKNWYFENKEQFLSLANFGNCWIEEATKL